MSHVFISYSHKDVTHRNTLVAKLDEEKIPYWYDKHIEGGRDWRDEIDTALEESFAVIVIVTANSMESHPVTYEWSWAIGNGLSVIPFIFEQLSITKIHAPLTRKQWILCIDEIPSTAIDTLRDRLRPPADTKYIDDLILHIVTPLRIYIRMIFSFRNVVLGSKMNQAVTEELLSRAKEKSEAASKELTIVLVDKSYSLTTKQLRSCRLLIEQIGKLDLVLWAETRENVDEDLLVLEKIRELYFEPSVRQFDLASDIHFEIVDTFFNNLIDNSLEFRYQDHYVLAVVKKFFPHDITLQELIIEILADKST